MKVRDLEFGGHTTIFFTVSFSVFPHIFKVVIHLLETWTEYTQWTMSSIHQRSGPFLNFGISAPNRPENTH